jgi:hypothetical protein
MNVRVEYTGTDHRSLDLVSLSKCRGIIQSPVKLAEVVFPE